MLYAIAMGQIKNIKCGRMSTVTVDTCSDGETEECWYGHMLVHGQKRQPTEDTDKIYAKSPLYS